MKKILIAEDEDGLRMLLERQLVRVGYGVTAVPDGQSALERLCQEPFDLVISDMKMPRLDGMGLLREAQERKLGVDFIVLTGHGSLEGAVEAFKSGNVVDYLLKPLEDIRMLSRIVARALEARELRAGNLEALMELTETYLSLVLDERYSEEQALLTLPNRLQGRYDEPVLQQFADGLRQRRLSSLARAA